MSSVREGNFFVIENEVNLCSKIFVAFSQQLTFLSFFSFFPERFYSPPYMRKKKSDKISVNPA